MSKYLDIIFFLVCRSMDKNKNSHSDKACEELVNEVNRMNLYQEKVKEMKSKTDTDLKL